VTAPDLACGMINLVVFGESIVGVGESGFRSWCSLLSLLNTHVGLLRSSGGCLRRLQQQAAAGSRAF
jgi:hypothetical protein